MCRGPDEELRGGAFIEDFDTGKRRHWKRSVCVYGSSVRGTRREVSFSEGLGKVSKSRRRRWSICLHVGLRKENLVGGSSTGTPRDMPWKVL